MLMWTTYRIPWMISNTTAIQIDRAGAERAIVGDINDAAVDIRLSEIVLIPERQDASVGGATASWFRH